MQWYENPDIMGPFMAINKIVNDYCDSKEGRVLDWDALTGNNVVYVDFKRGSK